MKEFHIQWHFLDRCNLRCKHCYQDNYTNANELNIEQLIQISDNLVLSMKKWGKRLNLLLTGGEPLLSDKIFELLKYLEDKKQINSTNIITNATLLDKNLKYLEKFRKCNTIFFSLDGVTQDSNDKIRGKGVFKTVLDQISLIDEKRFKKVMMFTVSKQNYEDAFNLIDFGIENRLDGIIIEKFIPLGQGIDNYSNVLTKMMLQKLYNFLLEKAGYQTFESYKYRALKIEFDREKIKSKVKDYSKLFELKAANCIINNDGCAIMPDASVYPCRRLPITIGNLLKDSLYDIYTKSDLLKNLTTRDLLEGKCRTCDIEDCFGCRAMVYAIKKNLYAQDPHCWR